MEDGKEEVHDGSTGAPVPNSTEEATAPPPREDTTNGGPTPPAKGESEEEPKPPPAEGDAPTEEPPTDPTTTTNTNNERPTEQAEQPQQNVEATNEESPLATTESPQAATTGPTPPDGVAAVGAADSAVTDQTAVDADAAAQEASMERRPPNEWQPPKKRRRKPEPMKPFNDMLYELLAFRAREGHCRVPLDAKSALGRWVASLRTQKSNLRKGYHSLDLNAERLAVLDSVGFVWDLQQFDSDARWKRQFEELLAFKNEHGHCNVPQSTPLGKWVKMQRGKSDPRYYWVGRFYHSLTHTHVALELIDRELSRDPAQSFRTASFWSIQASSHAFPVSHQSIGDSRVQLEGGRPRRRMGTSLPRVVGVPSPSRRLQCATSMGRQSSAWTLGHETTVCFACDMSCSLW